jgi:hypothetical protein
MLLLDTCTAKTVRHVTHLTGQAKPLITGHFAQYRELDLIGPIVNHPIRLSSSDHFTIPHNTQHVKNRLYIPIIPSAVIIKKIRVLFNFPDQNQFIDNFGDNGSQKLKMSLF